MDLDRLDRAVLVEDFKFWSNRKDYLDLMKQFLTKQISGNEFKIEYYKMWRRVVNHIDTEEELLHISDHVDLDKFKGFSSTISELFTDCDTFQMDESLRDKVHGISEDELRGFVRQAYLKIKDNYP